MPLIIKEIHENHSEGHRLDDGHWYEPFTEDKGELFRSMQKEHGACTSKIYNDVPDGTSYACGWYFRKSRQYEDAPETYLHGVWVLYKEVNESRVQC